MQSKGNFILFDSRNEFKTWLANQKVSRIIKLIQNHHTWIPNYSHFKGNNHFDRLESMRNSHIERDLGDVAQHLTTFPDGKIAYSVSRPFNEIPTGIKGANLNGICIEHFGNFDIGGDTMTEEHTKTILFLNKVLCEKFNLPIDTEHVVYHHWYAANGKQAYNLKTGSRTNELPAKTCPGTNFFKGNTVLDAKNNYIPLVKGYMEEVVKAVTPKPTKTLPQIAKERVYAENGVLKRCDGNYKIAATDVRHIKFETGKVKYKFVYEKGATVSSLVKKYGADFGFNAPFFHNGIPLGDTEDNDKIINAAYGKMLKWHEFAVVDGKPIIGQLDKNDKQEFLVQGAPLLVENGNMVYNMYTAIQEVNDDIAKSRCQRTFIWIDARGDLHLGIADGRVPNSDQGLTLQEMALYAKSHDAVWSLNFDGGDSTILADKSGGLNQKQNTGINERVVHHAILVFIEEDKEIKNENIDKEFEDMDKIKFDLKDGDKKLVVDGFLSNGTSYIEARTLAEFLGAQVGWDQENKRVSVKK